MAQNWTSIVEFNWIVFNIYLLIYIYIYMTYKFEFFLVIQKEKGS